jgi:glycosyltransferase involved in cell wall biosynthesis
MRMPGPIVAAPRVSFVVTNFNYASYIERAIDGLLGQHDVDLELVVIDDCSTDNSRAILQRYAGEPRVRLVFHERNRGNIFSYNEGLALARGDIVGTFDADDVCLRPDVVARQVAMFDAHPEVGLVYTGFAIVDEADRPFRESKPWASDHVRPAYEAFTDLLSLNTVPHSGALVRRSCHDVVGWYDPRLSYAGDWDLWLRLAGRFAVGYLAGPLYAYRVHRNNMTSRGKPPGEATRERMQAVENAFAALPPDTPAAVRDLRTPARRNALLTGTWNDRSFGRTRRSWIGLRDAIQRAPDLLLQRALYSAVAHLLVLTAIGHPRYERLALWRESRGRRSLSTPAGSRIADHR